jgi:lysophospholipase L1-like esterase
VKAARIAVVVASIIIACGGETDDSTTKDASASDAGANAEGGANVPIHPEVPSDCFKQFSGPMLGPNYDQFHPAMGPHCAGTQLQKIEGVERLVFLGDSITTGTPPTPSSQFYRSRVTDGIKARFGAGVTSSDCSKWGARYDDLFNDTDAGKPGQVQQCFPRGVEPKKTLIIMTMGGNDVDSWTKDVLGVEAGKREADAAGELLTQAVSWLKDPAHFPNGSFVILSNVYEYTDATGDIDSCAAAPLEGVPSHWPEAAAILSYFEEQILRRTIATGSDMIFLLESFCGHGYHHDDPSSQCYRGPNSDLWFDFTCIHPNPRGHGQVADLFLTVVDGHSH